MVATKYKQLGSYALCLSSLRKADLFDGTAKKYHHCHTRTYLPKQEMIQACQQEHRLQLEKFSAFKGKKFQLFGLTHKHDSGVCRSWSQFFLAPKAVKP